MLSAEENRRLTSTNAGTPMGELFRRFWLPVLTFDELSEPDGPPRRLRVMGEELIAFRDTEGTVGVVGAYCAHRRAHLFFGRNEGCGLRCVYHGWKFDTSGQCTEMPTEPPESTFRQRVSIESYPVEEHAGMIWVYMGPPDRRPELPKMGWSLVPDSHRIIARTFHECNYMQGLEGEIDTAHISFLHKWFDDEYSYKGAVTASTQFDPAPKLTVQETDYGFVYGGRRDSPDGRYLWRMTHWLVPTYAVVPYPSWPRGDKIWTPIDDEHSSAFSVYYHRDRPLTDQERQNFRNGLVNAPVLEPCAFQLPDGPVVDVWRPKHHRGRDYDIDRVIQKTRNFTGIRAVADQDRAMVEGMGRIVDRTDEHLGTTDIAVITARRRLLRMSRELEQGIEPYPAHHGDLYRVRSAVTTTDEADFHTVLESVSEQMVAR
ncbi:MAG: Rieske 2Fe-2S domain-containing protein [Chloroflexi bacterium]|nr:Rieske 2Fe-2S domain-containing protein [Chloroflexota bacterium]